MHFDIFNNDAFSLTALTKAIIDTPHVPGRIGELGLFSNEPIQTTSVSLESMGSTLSLVPAAARGAPGKPYGNEKRKMVSVNAIHLPQRTSIIADEVQNLRAFGKDSEVETAQNLMNKKLARMRRDIDVTLEYQRIGAIKGQVLDADGTTVLLDMSTVFDVGPQAHSMVLGTAGTEVVNKVIEAKRKMESALGGLMYKSIRVLCSASFFDALVIHPKVKDAYNRWMNGEFLRVDNRAGFYFAGVFWEEYRGNVSGQAFIADGTALMIPEGVPDLFVTHFAPADYMETVNTLGLAYYAKQEMMDFGKGIMVEAQSNPLSICTRPAAVVVLS